MKWFFLGLITATLIIIGFFGSDMLRLHDFYYLIVAFFLIQSVVFFRLDHLISDQWKPQLQLIKIVLRLLSSLGLLIYLMLVGTDLQALVLQFIIVYLIYMIFEIGVGLTNLREN